MFGKMWKIILEPDGSQMTIWRMRIACWIYKTANTHTDYLILIAFLLQQRLTERATVLRYAFCILDSSRVSGHTVQSVGVAFRVFCTVVRVFWNVSTIRVHYYIFCFKERTVYMSAFILLILSV